MQSMKTHISLFLLDFDKIDKARLSCLVSFNDSSFEVWAYRSLLVLTKLYWPLRSNGICKKLNRWGEQIGDGLDLTIYIFTGK